MWFNIMRSNGKHSMSASLQSMYGLFLYDATLSCSIQCQVMVTVNAFKIF